ncbi:MAG: GNAT family N-acetyltransferase [Bacteroidales bacterium]|nr:MAG: GNAT family N-acetyltransferase [Bacteroidales bacterium]
MTPFIDRTTVVDILCQSFDTNKSVNYVVKQGKYRKQRIRALMEYSYDVCQMFGKIYLSDDGSACALTLMPEQKRTSLKSIILDVKLIFSCIGLWRVFKVLKRDSMIKASYPNKSVFYLWFIGVRIADQNKGQGSALLSEIIKDADLIQHPIYLETSMSENVFFYKKHGFEVYKELVFDHKLFLLRRFVCNN